MKKIALFNSNHSDIPRSNVNNLFLLLFLALLSGKSWTQVTVSGALSGNGTYTTLRDAIVAVGTNQSGASILITISGNTTEAAQTLAPSVRIQAGTWASMTISPSGGNWTISGAATAGQPLLELSGADNVTIDGLNTGGNALIISNTTVSNVSNTCTIRFGSDATNNTITNCSILGSSTTDLTTNGGVIFFSTAGIAQGGNDNNTISNCNIGPANGNLPTKGIYMYGTQTAGNPTVNNSQNTFTNNNIYDFFGAAVSSAGVYIANGNTDNNVTNNRFYQTSSRTQTTGTQHSAIWINNTNGNNFQVTGNTIGYSGYSGGVGFGTYTFVGTVSTRFIPIFLSVGTTLASNASNNIIAGIAISGDLSGTATALSSPFCGIYINAGLTTCNENTIGSMTAVENITYTSSSANTSDIIGIFNGSSSILTTNGNNLGGFKLSNSNSRASNFYGFWYNTATTTWTCNNNTIGGDIANSIQSTTTATGTVVNGIRCNSGSTNVVSVSASGNIIRNLTAAGGTGTTANASVVGICLNATGANHTLSNNQIFNLSNTNTTAATVVTGIQFNGSTSNVNVVERNLIYGLTSATNNSLAEVNGIRVQGGTTTYRNNMIAIGSGISIGLGQAASSSGQTGINGINEAQGTNNFWHNSIYIGGTATTGAGASYAFNGTQIDVTRSFRNNIFVNARTNSGATGKHYSIKVNGALNPAGLTLNNNIYFTPGTGGVFGYANSQDVTSLSNWQTVVGQDANSYYANPQYIAPTNATPDLHINPNVFSQANASGFELGVTNDFDLEIRANLSPVDIGADAFAQSTALPIELVSIQANCKEDNTVAVMWTTASEHNTSYYVVDKSRDGINWNILGHSGAAGNSTQLLNYEMMDSENMTGTTYYRLTLFDINGEFELFGPVAADCDNASSTTTISTYPNPSNNGFCVNLFTEDMDGAGVLNVTDAKGAMVHTQDVDIQKGNSVFYMNNLNFAPGIYYIQVINGDNSTHMIKHLFSVFQNEH
jgi:hypothetical protein